MKPRMIVAAALVLSLAGCDADSPSADASLPVFGETCASIADESIGEINAWLAEQGPSFEAADWPSGREWPETKRRVRAAGCTVAEYHDLLDERRGQIEGKDELATAMRLFIRMAANPEKVKVTTPKVPTSHDRSRSPVQREIDRAMSKPPRIEIPSPQPLPDDLQLPDPKG